MHPRTFYWRLLRLAAHPYGGETLHLFWTWLRQDFCASWSVDSACRSTSKKDSYYHYRSLTIFVCMLILLTISWSCCVISTPDIVVVSSLWSLWQCDLKRNIPTDTILTHWISHWFSHNIWSGRKYGHTTTTTIGRLTMWKKGRSEAC